MWPSSTYAAVAPGTGTGGAATGGQGPNAGGMGGGGLGGIGSASGTGGVVSTGAIGATGQGAGGTAGESGMVELLGPPLLFRPTDDGFGLQVVTSPLGKHELSAVVQGEDGSSPRLLGDPTHPAEDITEWEVTDLEPGMRYEYLVLATGDHFVTTLYRGEVTTRRPPGAEYTVALLTDSHIRPREVLPGPVEAVETAEVTLLAVGADILPSRPDFVIHLGDMLDFHDYGFNVPSPSAATTRSGYLNYRRFLGDVLGNAFHFLTIGNWEGESGYFTPEEIERARGPRLLYLPGPRPDTYPEGGSPFEDYYAFTWGDALYVVLNVMTYTPTAHLLTSTDPGTPEDWTLGAAQLDWFERTLANASSKWRFVFIHHTVGGAAGNDVDATYGRGGGQAARVGEQAIVHELMMTHAVQVFFYGHDHVFTDMVVDGIHYTLPGSAGAPWKFTTAETGYTDYWPDSGHALIHVGPASVLVDFVAKGGTSFYSYVLE
ncbi:MAG: metallophosphoesterase [Polyangiaceae bacterium]|nr:metallophosphoesterase [Polyangiaceae bacterium]